MKKKWLKRRHEKDRALLSDMRRKVEKDRVLLNELVGILALHTGERGDSEGAVDVLKRVIRDHNHIRHEQDPPPESATMAPGQR